MESQGLGHLGGGRTPKPTGRVLEAVPAKERHWAQRRPCCPASSRGYKREHKVLGQNCSYLEK